MRKNPAEVCRLLQRRTTVGDGKLQDKQLEVTDLKMDLEVAYTKIDKLEVELTELKS
jgi:hypothetical protein